MTFLKVKWNEMVTFNHMAVNVPLAMLRFWNLLETWRIRWFQNVFELHLRKIPNTFIYISGGFKDLVVLFSTPKLGKKKHSQFDVSIFSNWVVEQPPSTRWAPYHLQMGLLLEPL